MRKFGTLVQSAFVLLSLAMTSSTLKSQAAFPGSLDVRRKALNAFFRDYWEDNLKNSPEFASSLGCRRHYKTSASYDQTFNATVPREREWMIRVTAIDPTGFTVQRKLSRDLLLRDLADYQQAAHFEEWERLIDQLGGVHTYASLTALQLTFASAKDYEDWIDRLHAIPLALELVTKRMSLGMKDHRVPQKYPIQKLGRTSALMAHQVAEDSLLALPVRRFLPYVSALEQTPHQGRDGRHYPHRSASRIFET